MNRRWSPSPLEEKCLRHLDAPGSWAVLRAQTPSDYEILPWKPFRRVFFFNSVLFFVVLIGLFLAIEKVMSIDPNDLKTDLPYGLAFSVGMAIALGIYVTKLYRQSWNKRARHLQELERLR